MSGSRTNSSVGCGKSRFAYCGAALRTRAHQQKVVTSSAAAAATKMVPHACQIVFAAFAVSGKSA